MMSLADLAVESSWWTLSVLDQPVLDTIIVTIVSLCQNFEVTLAKMHLNVSNFSYFTEGPIIFSHYKRYSITCMSQLSRASPCHAKQALFVENNTEEIFEAALEQSTDIMYSDVEIFVAIAR